MSIDFEEELRRRMRPVSPRRDLSAGVLARLRQPPPRHVGNRRWGMAAVLAAVVLAAVTGWGLWQARRTAQARADARQLVAALQLASTHLEHARSQIVRMGQ
jgi:hypothetical protein